jgi:hypothetical protein
LVAVMSNIAKLMNIFCILFACFFEVKRLNVG